MDHYLSEKNLLRSLSFEVLKGARLGIDVEYYFSRLLSAKKEPYLDATGGIPLSLITLIESDLAALSHHAITPVFVFPGLKVASQNKPLAEQDQAVQWRERTWESYYASERHTGYGPDTFRDRESVTSRDYIPALIRFLTSNNVEYMIAPYSSWAQLAYLYNHKESYVDAIYGPSELLLLDVDRIIVYLDFPDHVFKWLTKRHLFNDLGFNQEQFNEAAVASGFDFINTTFPLLEQNGYSYPIKSAQDIIFSGGNIYGTILSSNDTTYADKYRQAFSSIEFVPVLKENGRVELSAEEETETFTVPGGSKPPSSTSVASPATTTNGSNSEEPPNDPKVKLPNDTHTFIGQRLPHELYFYLSRGIIDTHLLEAITTGKYLDKAPLDGGRSDDYKKYLKSLNQIREKSLSLITEFLARYYQVKKIHQSAWYDPRQETELIHRVTPTVYSKVRSWVIRDNILLNNLPILEGLPGLISKLEKDDDFRKKTISTKPVSPAARPPLLQTDEEILNTALLRAFDLYGFVNNNDHKLTPWGKVLAHGLNLVSEKDKSFIEPIILAVSLLKDNAIPKLDQPLTPKYPGEPQKGTTKEKEYVTLISRFGGFLSLKQKPVNYYGPLNQSLLAFRSFIELLRSTLRNLIEASTVSLLANEEVNRLDRTNNDWSNLATKIPFADVAPNTVMAIVIHNYLEETVVLSNIELEKSSTTNLSSDAFKNVIRLSKERVAENNSIGSPQALTYLERSFQFFNIITDIINFAGKEGLIKAATVKQFTDANEWLSERK